MESKLLPLFLPLRKRSGHIGIAPTIEDNRGIHVCSLAAAGTHAERETIAAEIVLRYNAHGELREALANLLALIDFNWAPASQCGDDPSDNIRNESAYVAACALLAKAGK